jgi:hypothetical protein
VSFCLGYTRTHKCVMHLHTCRFVCVHERECVNNDILVYVRHTYTRHCF